MDIVALYTRLLPGKEEAYEQVHAVVPAELVADLRARGVSEWRIWRRGSDLFHVVHAADFRGFAASVATNAVAEGWDEAMAEFLEVGNDLSNPDGNLLREVWSLSNQLLRQHAESEE